MDVTPIIDQLRLSAAPLFRAIGGSVELDAAVQSAPVTPSAWVMPLAERPADPHLASAADQIVMLHFSVVICLANRRDATGSAAGQDLQALRLAVRDALLGWAPDQDTGDPCVYTGGRLLRFEDGRLWWADEFRVMTLIKSH